MACCPFHLPGDQLCVCECAGSPWRHTLATRHLPVFTCLHLFLLSPPEVSVLLMLMGVALYSSYKMCNSFLFQWPFRPRFSHVFCNIHIPFLFVVISRIPGTTMSFFYFEPFCIICFCCISYMQSNNDQYWVFTTFWVRSKALCIFNFPPNHYY